MEQEGRVSKGLEADPGPGGNGGFQVLSAEKYGGFAGRGQTVYLSKAKETKVHCIWQATESRSSFLNKKRPWKFQSDQEEMVQEVNMLEACLVAS